MVFLHEKRIMCPSISKVVLITFFGLFVNSLIVESFATNETEEDIYQSNVCSGVSICNLTVSPRSGLYKCFCDSNCSLYGDCCPESAYYNYSIQLNGKRDVQSFFCPREFGFYIINTCPPTFADDVIKRKCENVSLSQIYRDVKMMKPVMERSSRITYLNAYCAHCNGASNFENFTLNFTCSDVETRTPVEDKENLITILRNGSKFDPRIETLTSNVNDTDYECSRKIITPAHLQPYTRYCEPEMISSCPSTFNDSKIVEACHSQTYAVYTSPNIGSGDIYKNMHCAKCNGVNDTNILPCQTTLEIHTMSGSSTLFLAESSVAFCDDPTVADLPVC